MKHALSTSLTWLQLEMRGRTQLGEGVLEIKKPDWGSVLVLRPDLVGNDLLRRFAPLSTRSDAQALTTLGDDERVAFDEAYLECLSEIPNELRQTLDRELLAAVAERRDRRESVRADKTERRQQRRVAANADAYAARLAARMEPFPDPRNLLPNASLTVPVAIRGAVSGPLTIGEDLFTLGKVLADGAPIADTADYESACYVKAVLSHDPALREVDLPLGENLSEVMQAWTEQSRR